MLKVIVVFKERINFVSTMTKVQNNFAYICQMIKKQRQTFFILKLQYKNLNINTNWRFNIFKGIRGVNRGHAKSIKLDKTNTEKIIKNYSNCNSLNTNITSN